MEDHIDLPSTPPTPSSVGEQLRAAREAQGLSRADISAQTRVAERHLISIEEDRFSALAAPTYAVGFARAYAKAVGLDQADIAVRVRRQLAAQPHSRPTLPSFEPGDPARVPPSRIAWMAGLLAVVVVGLLVFYWSNFLSPEGELPDLVPDATQSAAAPVGRAKPAPQVGVGGPVMLTASAPHVWVKITDSAGKQLFQKELGQGESYVVPADAQGPQLRTARPDQLQITVGGRPVGRLGDKPQVVSGILLAPAALLSRAGGAASQPATQAGHVLPSRSEPSGQRSDLPPLPKMDDLPGGAEPSRPDAGAQDNPVSTTEH